MVAGRGDASRDVSRSEICAVQIAPRPALTRLDRSHDGMSAYSEMGGGMAARRGVATPHRSTRQAHAEMHPTPTGSPAFGTGQGWYGQRCRQMAEVRAAATCERALEPYAADLIGEELEGHSSRLGGRHCGRTAGPPAVRLIRCFLPLRTRRPRRRCVPRKATPALAGLGTRRLCEEVAVAGGAVWSTLHTRRRTYVPRTSHLDLIGRANVDRVTGPG